jgi:hypothetical protein
MEAAGAKVMNVAARRVTGLYASLPGLRENYALLPDERFGKSGGTLQSTAFCVMVHKDEGDRGEFVLSFLFCFVAKRGLMLTLGLRAGIAHGEQVSHLTACAYLVGAGVLSFMVYPMDEEELVGAVASPIAGYAVPLKVRRLFLPYC